MRWKEEEMKRKKREKRAGIEREGKKLIERMGGWQGVKKCFETREQWR